MLTYLILISLDAVGVGCSVGGVGRRDVGILSNKMGPRGARIGVVQFIHI